MKIIKRIIYSFFIIIYFILIVSTPFWWFIPLLFWGKSHKIVLDKCFDIISDYETDLFKN